MIELPPVQRKHTDWQAVHKCHCGRVYPQGGRVVVCPTCGCIGDGSVWVMREEWDVVPFVFAAGGRFQSIHYEDRNRVWVGRGPVREVKP